MAKFDRNMLAANNSGWMELETGVIILISHGPYGNHDECQAAVSDDGPRTFQRGLPDQSLDEA